jgi:hypothetical protein
VKVNLQEIIQFMDIGNGKQRSFPMVGWGGDHWDKTTGFFLKKRKRVDIQKSS